MTQPLILIDMDNTIVDFDSRFHEHLIPLVPKEIIDVWDKSNYWIEDSFPPEYHQLIHTILSEKGFFLNMDPIKGALEGLKEMQREGMNVIICTSPHKDSIHCIDEKREWVNQYLGDKFAKEMIFSYDKTEVAGDILVDDRTDLISKGKHHPTWTQVLFAAEHNRNFDAPYRLKDWKDWREVIMPLIKKNSD